MNAPHGPDAEPLDPWRRLDARVLLATAVLTLAPLVPTVLVMLLGSARMTTVALTAAAWIAFAVLATAAGAVDWSVTRYRVTTERFELQRGVLTRNHRSIPRDRVRSVDLTANPAQRVLGIAVVSIGTAEQGEQETPLKLDALARPDAEALRAALLDHPQTAEQHVDTGAVLARMRARWFGYAALTASLVLTVWGAVLSALSSLRDVLVTWGTTEQAGRIAGNLPLWLVIAGAVVFGLLLGVAGSLVISVEQWWRFRLSRRPNGTLLVHRGLLTTRAVSLEERRLRGAELAEPVLLRLFRGARLTAVTTGLGGAAGGGGTEKSALLPPAPRSAAESVAAAVLQRPWPAAAPVRHPRAALRRRLLRAALAVVPPAAVLAAVAWWGWLPVPAAVALGAVVLVVAAAFAVDAYRGLGHLLDAELLLARSGTAVRRTAVLYRGGIIGWRVRQTWFQRRAGVLTLGATTAAGSGHYTVRDVGVEDGWALADRAVPGLLAPFRAEAATAEAEE